MRHALVLFASLMTLSLGACSQPSAKANTLGTSTGSGGTGSLRGSGSTSAGITSTAVAASGSSATFSSAVAASGTSGTSGSGATIGSSAATTSGSASNSATATASSTGSGACTADGIFPPQGSAAACCSGMVNGSGFCAGTVASTGSTGTSGTGSSSGSSMPPATGSTTGSMCPNNVPDLNTGLGTTTISGSCSHTSEIPCPPGYMCNANNQCQLNGSDALQVTLSFDNIEDFDLHLVEPLLDGGSCEIYYGNAGSPPDAGICQFLPFFCNDAGMPLFPGSQGCPAGWLDRDTNAACGQESGDGMGGEPDAVNVENILFQNGAPLPHGTYTVRVDYWENCDTDTCADNQDSSACGAGHPSSPIAVQVRLPNGAIDKYCENISEAGQGPNDTGQNGASFADEGGAGSGVWVTTFTIP